MHKVILFIFICVNLCISQDVWKFLEKDTIASPIAHKYTYQELLTIIKGYYIPLIEPYLEDIKINNYRDMIFYKGDPDVMRNDNVSCTFDKSWKTWFGTHRSIDIPSSFVYSKGLENEEFEDEEFEAIFTNYYRIDINYTAIPPNLIGNPIDNFPGSTNFNSINWNKYDRDNCPSCVLATENEESSRHKDYYNFELWFRYNKLSQIRIKNLKSWKIIILADKIKQEQDSIKQFKIDSIQAYKVHIRDSVVAAWDSIKQFKADSIKFKVDSLYVYNKHINDSIVAYKDSVRHFNDSALSYQDSIKRWKIDSIRVDSIKMAEYIQVCAGAEKGINEMEYMLGNYYFSGSIVSRNDTIAFEWYGVSAKKGYAPSMYKLGICYSYGYGVKKNVNNANKWFKKAMKKGLVGIDTPMEYKIQDYNSRTPSAYNQNNR